MTVFLPPGGGRLLRQPRGLATLFLTEMWERFSYYGVRAILILFLVAPSTRGGLGIDDRTASAILGLYLAGTYVFSLFGGWVADRLIGAQRAVVAGGSVIAVGNAMLVSGNQAVFFLGLLLNVIGVGLLKPNISALVASLYPEGGSRRDAGVSIFYMGINCGSFLGALLVPLVAYWAGWHWGFVLTALGMLIGLAQFKLTCRYLGSTGLGIAAETRRGSWLPVIACATALVLAATFAVTRQSSLDPVAVAAAASWLIGLLAAAYFIYLIFFAGIVGPERKRLYVMVALFIACACFWAGVEQIGASFSLFAARYTDRNILGREIPAGVLLTVNPVFVIAFSPVFAAVWLSLGKRGKDFSAPAKFAAGLILMGLGFLPMYFASGYVMAGAKVSPLWLIGTYLLHTWGELCLSPVGISSMTKLSPPRHVGQVMGMWFLAVALGNNLAGQLSGLYDANDLESLPGLFIRIFWWGVICGGVLLLLTPGLKRLMDWDERRH